MLKKNITLSLCLLTTSFIKPHNFKFISIKDLLPQRPDIAYIKCHDVQPFEYKPFPIARFPELHPNKGLLAETFILKIPNGQVCSTNGWIKTENTIISNFINHFFSRNHQMEILHNTPFKNLKKIPGKVAVITMPFDLTYGHWIYNILSRLALIEEQNITYDWLYVACDKPYMRETLTLLGVDLAKVIQPFENNAYIEADELIIPSQVGVRIPQSYEKSVDWIPLQLFCQKWNMDPKTIGLARNTIDPKLDILPPKDIPIEHYFFKWAPLCGCYISDWLIDYLQKNFLPCTKSVTTIFSKHVFISRKNSSRHITNEDEIFILFKPLGFERYFLETMSIPEQIALFQQAQIIVATNGSSLTNLIFCKPKTEIIEIFLTRSDSTFYYFSDILKLNHHCIKTMEFETIEGALDADVDPIIIQDFIEKNNTLFINTFMD